MMPASAVCYAAGMVCQKLALRHASAVQVTVFGCFTGTAACMPFAGQFLSQLGSGQHHALARTTSGGMGATIYAVPTLVIMML